MRNFLIKLLVIFPLAFGAVSCNDEDEYLDITSPYVSFKGDWEGSFKGTDSGTMEFTVDDNGKIAGTLKSNNLPQSNFDLEGAVDLKGAVKINYIYAGTVLGGFEGTMDGLTGSGAWSVSHSGGSFSGTWSANKL